MQPPCARRPGRHCRAAQRLTSSSEASASSPRLPSSSAAPPRSSTSPLGAAGTGNCSRWRAWCTASPWPSAPHTWLSHTTPPASLVADRPTPGWSRPGHRQGRRKRGGQMHHPCSHAAETRGLCFPPRTRPASPPGGCSVTINQPEALRKPFQELPTPRVGLVPSHLPE